MSNDIHGKEHALITLFNRTGKGNFPLILIIGREPNNTNKFNNKVGKYFFEDAPTSAFWNISYKKIGELKGLNVKDFKRLCNEKKTSP
ncbi:MAG: hypothetical protein Q8L29_04375, partial [archaeon]|nr:hypothetical protein [archaeon]